VAEVVGEGEVQVRFSAEASARVPRSDRRHQCVSSWTQRPFAIRISPSPLALRHRGLASVPAQILAYRSVAEQVEKTGDD
jgi:hypothetical protein